MNRQGIKVSLLTGGGVPHYVLGLLSGLVSQGIEVDFIGSDEMSGAAILKDERVNFYNLRGDQDHNAPIGAKISRIFKYYYKLVRYAVKTDSKLFHIQWLNKFVYFDRIFLNIFYKLLGKKLVFTAHNINAEERNGTNTLLNKLTLKSMYYIVDHVVVHTEKMKLQLMKDFNVESHKISVIPHGIIDIVPKTGLTRAQARSKLNLEQHERVILFFGIITSYKGLDYLVLAMERLKKMGKTFKLIIAGKVDVSHEKYWENIHKIIEKSNLTNCIVEKIEFIPDNDVEIYFKAADTLILPYLYIFQSGLPFLAYNFGLPIVATDVGSFKEEIIEGKTGFICQKENPEDLADKIALYFQSDLYKNLESNRGEIMRQANEKYGWEKIGEKTASVYRNLSN